MNRLQALIIALSFGLSICAMDKAEEYGFTPLHLAAKSGDITSIKKLLDEKANIQAKNRNGNTPLHSAAYGNQSLAIIELVSRGAHLNAQNNDGDTPLHSAAWKNNALAVKTLIEQNAELEMKNNDGDTPLHISAWNNSLAAVTTLTQKGANLDAKNKDNQTPSDLAQQKNNTAIITAISYAHNFLKLTPRIQQLAQRISAKASSLKNILSDYQTEDVTSYEIERSIRTLNGLNKNNMHLGIEGKINSAAIMLPSNLPLYSLVIFALIPSFLSKEVNIRPNSLLQEHNIISRLCNELDLDKLFPEITVLNTDHAGFKKEIQKADLVVFTGQPKNANAIIQQMKKQSVLILNGSGHNPVVVTESADIQKAVEGALLVKKFNGGQDCAGPDAILVHESVARKFIDQFHKKFSSLKTGTLADSNTQIGPIKRFSELQKFADIFHSNSRDIISGGIIDFKNGVVHPTTIVRGIERYPNYKEMFGPVAFIHPYKTDQDLAYYFQDINGAYAANRMYVTVYGHSNYIATRDDNIHPNNPGNVGIVLYDETIHDVEIGYKPYGGYSLGASGVIKKAANGMQKVAMPTLVPAIIAEYLIKNKDLPYLQFLTEATTQSSSTPSVKKDKEIYPVIHDFQKIVAETFGQDLIFGFVFGSAAKGKLKVKGHDRDDLDTFVCIKEHNESKCEEYLKRLTELHERYNLKVDEKFPAEIVTLDNLERTIHRLEDITVSISEVISGDKFDHMFWIHALTDKKVGFVGDSKKISQLIQYSSPYINQWRDAIIEQLKGSNSLPAHLSQKFSGLSKEDTIEKLSKHSPHLVVHLGLNYDDGQGKAAL